VSRLLPGVPAGGDRTEQGPQLRVPPRLSAPLRLYGAFPLPTSTQESQRPVLRTSEPHRACASSSAEASPIPSDRNFPKSPASPGERSALCTAESGSTFVFSLALKFLTLGDQTMYSDSENPKTTPLLQHPDHSQQPTKPFPFLSMSRQDFSPRH